MCFVQNVLIPVGDFTDFNYTVYTAEMSTGFKTDNSTYQLLSASKNQLTQLKEVHHLKGTVHLPETVKPVKIKTQRGSTQIIYYNPSLRPLSQPVTHTLFLGSIFSPAFKTKWDVTFRAHPQTGCSCPSRLMSKDRAALYIQHYNSGQELRPAAGGPLYLLSLS